MPFAEDEQATYRSDMTGVVMTVEIVVIVQPCVSYRVKPIGHEDTEEIFAMEWELSRNDGNGTVGPDGGHSPSP